jgi:hypothetical protein
VRTAGKGVVRMAADSHRFDFYLPPRFVCPPFHQIFMELAFFGFSTASMSGVGALEKRIHWPKEGRWPDPGEPQEMDPEEPVPAPARNPAAARWQAMFIQRQHLVGQGGTVLFRSV